MCIKPSLSIIGYSAWCGLGFFRGINSYIYNYKKYDEPAMYINSVGYGIFGIIIYGNPIFLPFILYKEVYRIEVNMRNLETEKKSDFYNNLL